MILKDVFLHKEGMSVLDSVNLQIHSGDSIVIFGRSGSGKTSLLKAMAGLIKIEEGEVLFNGLDVAKMDEEEFFNMQAQSGFVFQDSALWANKTLYENLATPLRILKPDMSRNEINDKIVDAVSDLNFRNNLMVRPSAVSSGEKKIVSILRALMTNPDILFFDEPTSSLDRKNINRINGLIGKLKSERKTIITVTKDFNLAKSIADLLILIEEGKIIRKGNFMDITGSYERDIEDLIEEVKGQVSI